MQYSSKPPSQERYSSPTRRIASPVATARHSKVVLFRRNGGVNKTLFETANCTLFSINSHHFPTNASADFSHATNFKAKAKLGNAKKGAAATTCLAAHLHCLLPKKSK